jgi:hypothetical protein
VARSIIWLFDTDLQWNFLSVFKVSLNHQDLGPTVQQRRDDTCITQYWVSSQNLNTQKYRISVVSLAWDNAHVLSLESETSILYCLRWLIPPKTYLIHKICGHIEEKTKTIFFFICKSKSKTMDFLTNKRNTDTGIRLKIKMIQSDTNTCLISVAPLLSGIHWCKKNCFEWWISYIGYPLFILSLFLIYLLGLFMKPFLFILRF